MGEYVLFGQIVGVVHKQDRQHKRILAGLSKKLLISCRCGQSWHFPIMQGFLARQHHTLKSFALQPIKLQRNVSVCPETLMPKWPLCDALASVSHKSRTTHFAGLLAPRGVFLTMPPKILLNVLVPYAISPTDVRHNSGSKTLPQRLL